MKTYNEITRQFLSAAGLVRIFVRNSCGEQRLWQVTKARADKLVRDGRATRQVEF